MSNITPVDSRVTIVAPPVGVSEVADEVRRQQHGELRELDKVLLNSEPFTQGWQAMFSQIRYNSTVPGDIREIMILRVAALEGAAYEWRLHEDIGRKEGLTTEQLLLIRDSTFSPHGRKPSPFTEAQLAAIAFTDASTRNAHIPDSIFREFKKHMKTDRQVVEATLTVAGYNMVARILIALNVDGASEDPVPIPQ
ncbi:Carboxymuconolactone decarboxylase [Ceratobasidium theobromae]|uniref:Carboxymuconolactone decarboxylase n=1 Tax=Ceratobasidium theobromae TaxID=1582974 RepID=A0A5N5Q8Y4_9AGAM|nr:Carboxymuconolactone decarboxylase [Ceratobasidium theobromae]